MEIVIFRHGDSLSISESRAKNDFDRILSEKGRKEIEESAKNLKLEGFSGKLIISSPLKRAIQSGEILAKNFNIKNIITTNLLKNGSDINRIIDYIKNFNENLIVVSHIPLVSYLTLHLLNQKIEFTTGSYVRIKFKENQDAQIVK
jgi:phosphohistidine phosphatase